MKLLRPLAAWLIASYTRLLYMSCRFYYNFDPREELRAAQQNYVFAILHSQQVAALMGHGEKRNTAMLSRSSDGDLMVRALKAHRVLPVRGSSRKGNVDKGGRQARDEIIQWLSDGKYPATIAIDGPRGPRGEVKSGTAVIAARSNSAILPVIAVARRRHILKGTWDRMQIPKFFSRIDVYFGKAIPGHDAMSNEEIEAIRLQAQLSLRDLEKEFDAEEFERCQNHRRTG